MSINEYTPMLLSTVNNSIGDKNLHFTVDKLLSLFNKKCSEFTELEKYAVDTIQTEATSYEINSFKNYFHINSKNIDYLLSCKPY
ncbi:hypothetical protein FE243_05210 [Aliarcobacter thereius]|uniref:Uncharacterized protein n=1 Tax=Aliarcobacter thereius TaxID=544718 RepID=A0A5R9H019_9BACT|nr:hypothetical protein [Aliarcobacter thereius]TLS71983.1 hypothetical protein FE246_06045 [Aliarcobacter thereius]TLT07243.1 hypothetical protein FE243_05210 [Aliarcobacter thereius]